MKSTDWKHSGIEQSTGIDTSESWVQEVLLKSLMSTEFFAETFMSETFRDPMTYQHKDAWRLIDSPELPKVAMCCWRGFGKSSMTEAKIIKGALFRQNRHVMFVGATEQMASVATENIKHELLGNKAIRDVFGWMKPDQRAEIPLGFSKKSYYLVDPNTQKPICFVHPKGANQSLRGVRVKIMNAVYRPDLIAIDDLEDDEEVLNEDIRKKLNKWFGSALTNCVGRERPSADTGLWCASKNDPNWLPPWRMIYADTVKHEDALIVNLMGDSEWHYVRYAQSEFRTDDDGERRLYSLVPEILTDAQVRAEYETYRKANNLDGYYQEKMCLPMAVESACWTRDMFKYYSEDAVTGLNKNPEVERFIIVDPAKTANMRSCPSGVLVVAADYATRKIMIRREVNERLTVSDLLDKVLNLSIAYNTRTVAVEITGLEDVAKHLFVSEAMNRGLNSIDFVWLDAKALPKGDFGSGAEKAKRARASTILPYYERGLVYHELSLAGGALERQELSYPKSAGWDLMDCAGYIPRLLSMGGRYFDAEIVDNPLEIPVYEEEFDWDELGKEIESGSWRYI